ncbi:MAG TPA: outer membrane lipoprotein carrier protein LolA [Candidatus Binataceae bacterium]|nr:outer membrane lipoprotein carrier protein LolA [Candidatus Binataceae bacterium]
MRSLRHLELSTIGCGLGLTILTLFGGVAGWSATTAPEPAGLARLLNRIQTHYQSTHTLSADFAEEIAGISGNRALRSGHVDYQKPGRFRWEFNPPHRETIVSDGHQVYDYQPDLQQVLEMPLARAFQSAAPVAFLLGFGNLQRDFNATMMPPIEDQSGRLLQVALVPKGGGQRLVLGVGPNSYDLRTVTLTDGLGNKTSLVFTNVHRNRPLAASLFQFTVPPGTDIIAAPAAGATPR